VYFGLKGSVSDKIVKCLSTGKKSDATVTENSLSKSNIFQAELGKIPLFVFSAAFFLAAGFIFSLSIEYGLLIMHPLCFEFLTP
jgi:hypothetical protein